MSQHLPDCSSLHDFCCSDIFLALKEQETGAWGDGPWPNGDGGNAIGAYQLHKGYFADATAAQGCGSTNRPGRGQGLGASPATGAPIRYPQDLDGSRHTTRAQREVARANAEHLICCYNRRYGANTAGPTPPGSNVADAFANCQGTWTMVERAARTHQGGPRRRYGPFGPNSNLPSDWYTPPEGSTSLSEGAIGFHPDGGTWRGNNNLYWDEFCEKIAAIKGCNCSNQQPKGHGLG